ncbi:MAG TPA: hypothetical protein VJ828_11665 [Lacipirellulaceae bacterium]|nr:hypothetical protein [Lacipirellulaceae bacterium]
MSTRILLPYFLSAFLLSGSWATSASAQWYYVASYEPYAAPMYYGYYPYYGYYGYYGGYHPSTVVEGYLRGRAELIEARSIASLYYAQALKEREEARSQYLENRMADLLYHAERRELRDQENARRLEEQAQRREARQQLRAQQHADKPPLIDWPAELMAESYQPIRTEIEALVKLRSELGNQAGEATRLAIRHALKELAKQVVEDERAARLSEEQSKSVRQFVRHLAATSAPPTL